jgi:Ser/Thr protein kinase RdoA (MazF antagonist)
MEETIRAEVLPRFGLDGAATVLAPFGNGLINRTWLCSGAGGAQAVLQWVNPIFPTEIHENIQAVTLALERAGLTTPVLIPTVDGRLHLEIPRPAGAREVWRLLSYVHGASFDTVGSLGQARSAGALVARFHRALDGLTHRFVGLRAGVHDTPAHLDRLRAAVAAHAGHRLFAEVEPLAARLLETAAALAPLPPLPPRVCHGDLKLNNVLFEGSDPAGRERAFCLIDLDTVAPMPLAFELGDAWRSWCNRSGEDRAEAELDLGVLESSLDGYREGIGRALTGDERRAMLLGPDWISLELACRFAADALAERYFGWDASRFPGRGEHNLTRARGQWSLHQAFAASRPARSRMLGI